MDNDCPVCEKHRSLAGLPGGFVFQDDLIFVAHFPLPASEPCYLGHLILEFRRHIVKPSELSIAEARRLGLWMQKIPAALEDSLGAEHTYIFRIGDKTPHLHFHFVPRYPGTPREFWNLQLNRWPGAEQGSVEKIQQVSERLRFHLSGGT